MRRYEMSKDKCTESEDIKLDKKRKALGTKLKEAYIHWREIRQLFNILKIQYRLATEEQKMEALMSIHKDVPRVLNYKTGIFLVKADGKELNKCECCGKSLRKKENCYTRPINVAFHTETGVEVRSTPVIACKKCRNKKLAEWPNPILGYLFINGYNGLRIFEIMMRIAREND